MNAEDYIVGHWIPGKIWTHLTIPKHQKRFNTLLRYVVGKTCVDVGCAVGHSTMHMNNLSNGKFLWSGIDFSETAIKEAVKLKVIDCEFLYTKELTNLTSKYDTVICSEVIEHVEDPLKLIKDLLFLANKRVVISTPSKVVNDPGHLQLITFKQWEKWLVGYKYTIVNEESFWYVSITK